MGSGFGEGDNRAQEAAQEAISSPLLDNVSIAGAQGVLINITGGMDLAIDEVTQISSIIQEEAGDEAEIIFGAVHDPELEGKIRVTVIAPGFDTEGADILRPDFRRPAATRGAGGPPEISLHDIRPTTTPTLRCAPRGRGRRRLRSHPGGRPRRAAACGSGGASGDS